MTVEQALIENAAKAICRVLGGSWEALQEESIDDETPGRMALRVAAKEAIIATGAIWADNVDPNPNRNCDS